MTTIPALETQLLRKKFGDNIAVKGLTLQVNQGEVFGFLGPNGAGKTTSIKMLLGLIYPTSGSADLLGRPMGDRQVRGRIGFLPEHFRFHDWLTASEFLTLHGQLYGMPEGKIKAKSQELIELLGLTAFSGKQLKTFSKGMLQRIGIAQALLNDPDLIFLDEPTSGLDPVGRRLVRDIIHEQRARGTTVFINSHLLSEIEVTCDRVAFIKHGEVLKVIELDQEIDGQFSLVVRGRNFTPHVMEVLAKLGSEIRVDDNNLNMVVSDESFLPEINRFLVENKVDVYSFVPQRISLEDMFIQTVGTDGGL
ncbi:MAG: ATP-binding cassette domain-containing protein [Anaerolineaceae bacterium]